MSKAIIHPTQILSFPYRCVIYNLFQSSPKFALAADWWTNIRLHPPLPLTALHFSILLFMAIQRPRGSPTCITFSPSALLETILRRPTSKMWSSLPAALALWGTPPRWHWSRVQEWIQDWIFFLKLMVISLHSWFTAQDPAFLCCQPYPISYRNCLSAKL